MYYSDDVSKMFNLRGKDIWRSVRRAGVEPRRINGGLCIDAAQLAELEKKFGKAPAALKKQSTVPTTANRRPKGAPRKATQQGEPVRLEKRDGYLYVVGGNVPEPWNWAASVGK